MVCWGSAHLWWSPEPSGVLGEISNITVTAEQGKVKDGILRRLPTSAPCRLMITRRVPDGVRWSAGWISKIVLIDSGGLP